MSFAIAAAVAALTACGGPQAASNAGASAPVAAQAPPAPAVPASQASPSSPARAGDDDLPPLPVTPFPAARPPEIVRAVFTFAARHPEVLSKMPCFCGCESRGHRHNDDCFVSARDASGRVTAWEPHGVG
jgi:hypothetical protein